jgi:plastocyanin
MALEKMNRREALKLSGMGMVALFLPTLQRSARAAADSKVVEIKIISNYNSGQVYFDPIGVFIEKGQTIRWVSSQLGNSVFAFHPDNDNHELRIPETAKSFNSGKFPLMRSAWKNMNRFEWTFDVEGTYDYYSREHEILGAVGRIVVGKPGGPGEKPPGYGGRDGRAVVFPKQIAAFEAVPSKDIVAKKLIAFPRGLNAVSHPNNPVGM